jgi:hypothetical protein
MKDIRGRCEAARAHVLRKTGNTFDLLINADLGYKRAASLDAFQLALVDQFADSLANGGTADLKLLTQFQFRRDLRAGFPDTGIDLFFDKRFKLKIERQRTFTVQFFEFLVQSYLGCMYFT